MRPNGRAKRKWVATDRKMNNALSFDIFFELVSKFHNFFFSIYLFLKIIMKNLQNIQTINVPKLLKVPQSPNYNLSSTLMDFFCLFKTGFSFSIWRASLILS